MTDQLPTDRSLRAEVEIASPPDEVWRVISDVRRTGEWSPECMRVVPLGGVRRGGWLIGLNRRGRVRWPTVSRLVSVEPGREIAWDVRTNGSRWRYRLEPTGTGTRLIETREVPNRVGRVATLFTRAFLGGDNAHDAELQAGMATGLGQIKSLIEG